MRTIEYRGRIRQVPERIEELTPEQYRRYLEISLMYDRGMTNQSGLRSKLLTLLLGESVDISFLSEELVKEALSHISLTTPFIVTGEKRERLSLETCVNLLKEWNGWEGPGDMLEGVKFGDFIDCNSLVKLLAKARAQEETERLSVEFCRKLYRNEWNQEDEPDEILRAHSLIFFHSVMKAIHNDPIDVNGERIHFAILFEKSERQNPDDHTGWTGAAMEIAEAGAFGIYREVLDTPLWDILIYLYRKRFAHIHNK